jgi:hypothetical protein
MNIELPLAEVRDFLIRHCQADPAGLTRGSGAGLAGRHGQNPVAEGKLAAPLAGVLCASLAEQRVCSAGQLRIDPGLADTVRHDQAAAGPHRDGE